MALDYVGVEDTLMPLGLQQALRDCIAAAIARREERRRKSPSCSYHTSSSSSQPRGSPARRSQRRQGTIEVAPDVAEEEAAGTLGARHTSPAPALSTSVGQVNVAPAVASRSMRRARR